MQTAPAHQRTTRILIVDDHPIVRAGLVQLLADEANLEVCGEAADASDALQKLRELKPNMLLIDVSLDGTNGIELVKQIKSIDKDLMMLVVSMHDDKLYAERALRAGAMGYINKQEVSQTIVAAIRQVLRGQVYLSKSIADRMLHRVVNHHDQDIAASPIESLSDRELEVFELIGQGITTGDIAKKLHLSTKTIETHRENIKSKLRLRNANELIRHAVQWTLEKA